MLADDEGSAPNKIVEVTGSGAPLAMRIDGGPRVFDADAASRLLQAIEPVLGDLGAGERDLIAAIGSCSPYLNRLIFIQ